MTTAVNKTIKASGGDYATMAALEAANANLVSLDESWTVTCDNIDDTTAVNFNGWTTDATRFLKIKAADAHGSTGRVTTSSYRLTNAAASPLQMTAIGAGGLVIFEGIQFKCANVNIATVTFASTAQAGAKVRFLNCVFENTGYGFIVAGSNLPVSSEIINCVFICGKNCLNRQYGSMWVYGCTFVSTVAFWPAIDMVADDATTRVFKNCYAKGAVSATAYVNMTGVSVTKTFSHDATTGTDVSKLYDTNNFNNVTATTENLIPKAGSALLVGGADRSGDAAPFNYTTDIRGDLRPVTTDDIGPWQVTPAVVAPVTEFHADDVSITAGDTVTFTDESTNTPTSWAWTFGTGEGTSTSQNPTHKYSVAGTFTVTLTATNAGGSDLETKTSYITVLPSGGRKIFVLAGLLR